MPSVLGLPFVWCELVASTRRPVPGTRNLRVAGGPAAQPRESDPRALGTNASRDAAA